MPKISNSVNYGSSSGKNPWHVLSIIKGKH